MARRRSADLAARALMWVSASAVTFILASMAILLLAKTLPLIGVLTPGELLLSSDWDPLDGKYGLLGVLLGTLYVTAIALSLAIPISLLSSILIAEYAPGGLGRLLRGLIDVLAGVPSVVYGMCAILVLVPFVRDVVGPALDVRTQGFCVLTAGITLSVMVFPIIISLSTESMLAVPQGLREASLSMGATRWETVKKAVLRRAMPGIASAMLLGFGRAIGETMAVAMLVGNKTGVPSGPLSPASTFPSLIIANYGEMMSVPDYEASLMMAALLLLLITAGTTIWARAIVRRATRRWGA